MTLNEDQAAAVFDEMAREGFAWDNGAGRFISPWGWVSGWYLMQMVNHGWTAKGVVDSLMRQLCLVSGIRA